MFPFLGKSLVEFDYLEKNLFFWIIARYKDMKRSTSYTESRERNKKMIIMEDITSSDTGYTSHSGSEIQKPHNVAFNKVGVGENLIL